MDKTIESDKNKKDQLSDLKLELSNQKEENSFNLNKIPVCSCLIISELFSISVAKTKQPDAKASRSTFEFPSYKDVDMKYLVERRIFIKSL